MHPIARLSALALAGCVLATAAAGALEEAAGLPDLSAHRWRHRVLVIDTPATNDERYARQATALLPEWSGLLERDLRIVTRSGEGVSTFRLRLVGKDGGVKLDSADPVAADALFALIDAMPMRRAESAQDR